MARRACLKPIDQPMLTPLEWQALRLAAKEADEHRALCPEGDEQGVRLTLELAGLVTVRPRQAATTSERPKLETLLALVLEELRPADCRQVIARVGEKCQAFIAGGEPPEPAPEEREAALELLRRVTRRATAAKWGAVTGIVRAVPTRRR